VGYPSTFEIGIFVKKWTQWYDVTTDGLKYETVFPDYIMNGMAWSPPVILERDRRCNEDELHEGTVNYPSSLSSTFYVNRFQK